MTPLGLKNKVAKAFQLGGVTFLHIIGVCAGYSALWIWGYQIFWWLKDGRWIEFPLMKLLFYIPRELWPSWFTSPNSWLQDPQSWFGLHKLATKALSFTFELPASLIFFVMWALLFVVLDSSDWGIESVKMKWKEREQQSVNVETTVEEKQK